MRVRRQAAEIATHAKGGAKIVGQAADVGASTAHHFEMHHRQFYVGNGKFVDGERAGFQHYVFAFAGSEVHRFAIALDGGMYGRHLQNIAGKMAVAS